jgi:alkylated DNA repair dioxygenase AlkB
MVIHLSDRSFLTSSKLPDSLMKYAETNFDNFMAMRPDSSRVIMFNKNVESPRLHMSYLCTPEFSNPNYSYMFCGLNEAHDHELPAIFQPFLDYVNQDEKIPYNQVTINWYRDGNDYIEYHSDYTDHMAATDVLVLSLGATRRFDLKSKALSKRIWSSPLHHGDILIMHGDTQKEFRHRVPKEPQASARISITFRKYKTSC